MTTEDRGLHPDLVEETLLAQAEQPEPAPLPRREVAGPRRSAEPAAVESADAQPDDTTAAPTAEPGSPEWLAQVDEQKDPIEKFKLLSKNLPRDVLEKDEVISGLVGHKADAMLRARQQQEVERQKREAAQNNDLYTLGELTQRELQEREQMLQQQAAAQSGTFMDGVVLFQSSLEEEVQREVAGQTYGANKGPAAGVAEYLQVIRAATRKLDRAELEREFQRKESALRKSVLSEVNGDEPVPERESGTPGRVREVTDEQIEAMTMQEYNALFDEAGRPKPGVRHRATRGIPLTQR